MDVTQTSVVNAIMSGNNVLLTGAAGTGKTYTIRKAIGKIRHQVALTSMTGVSAVLLGGRTLHSFLGIGLAKTREDVLDGIRRKAKTISGYKTIIIDEVGMLSADLLTWIDGAMCEVFGGEHFGNRQMIFSGDLYQLGPVSGDWFFKSTSWKPKLFQVFDLRHLYRHSDPKLGELLIRVRGGDAEAVKQIAEECSKKLPAKDGVVSTKLFALNRSVDRINQLNYERLNTPEKIYTAIDANSGKPTSYDVKAIDAVTPRELHLKVGTQVMVTRNIDVENQVCNGTKGVVVDMLESCVIIQTIDGRRLEIQRFDTEVKFTDRSPKTTLRRSQFPLKLAWATTIHKSQGATIDYVSVSLKDCFAPGQIYTALSRVRTSAGLFVSELPADPNWTNTLTDAEVVSFYKNI